MFLQDNEKQFTILVIDDDPGSLGAMNNNLEHHGFRVVTSLDGQRGFERAKFVQPDLILLDIMMPGTDGFEICAWLKNDNTTKDIPVIFISAATEIVDKVKGFELGAVDYITKPFIVEEVLMRIQTHLTLHTLTKEMEIQNIKLEQENYERKRAQHELKKLNCDLEKKIEERTADLVHTNKALKKEIKERTKLENQLIQAQKMEAIGVLAGGIAHDFNNILFPIIGHAEMLLDDIPKGGTLEDGLKSILKGAVRASDLVKQILSFSRQAKHEKKPLQIQSILSEIIKLVRSTLPPSIEICHNIDKKCGPVMADPIQIHQIIMNLVTNSFHAMEDNGGRLKISLEDTENIPGKINNLAPAKNGYICLSIADTGAGMNKTVIDRMFDPYFTTKAKGRGTGLGLSVVHGIVKSYNGEIRVSSTPGKGSIFKIYFPKISLQNDLHTDIDIIVPTGSEHILLVDDEETIADIEKMILESLGYKVCTRLNSIDALNAFNRNPEKYDLVITDLAMPNMNGDLLAQKMLEIKPDIPIILCTGFDDRINDEKMKLLGIKEYLFKPILKNTLAVTIRNVLD